MRRAIDGEEGVAELAEHYPMSFAAVQKHVAILEQPGRQHRIGRRKVVRYQPRGAPRGAAPPRPVRELWRERVERMAPLISGPAEEADT